MNYDNGAVHTVVSLMSNVWPSPCTQSDGEWCGFDSAHQLFRVFSVKLGMGLGLESKTKEDFGFYFKTSQDHRFRDITVLHNFNGRRATLKTWCLHKKNVVVLEIWQNTGNGCVCICLFIENKGKFLYVTFIPAMLCDGLSRRFKWWTYIHTLIQYMAMKISE